MTEPIRVLWPTQIKALRPTQMTVGLKEVARKRSQARCTRSAPPRLIVPVAVGPADTPYVLDHHHALRAQFEDGADSVLAQPIADLSDLSGDAFWSALDARGWCHPYDAEGRRCSYKDIPHLIGALADDPYRSLAGALRRAGGFSKSATPFAEFVWADYLRTRIAEDILHNDFERAVEMALTLAGSGGEQRPLGACRALARHVAGEPRGIAI